MIDKDGAGGIEIEEWEKGDDRPAPEALKLCEWLAQVADATPHPRPRPNLATGRRRRPTATTAHRPYKVCCQMGWCTYG